jgi:hypothetical protein
MMKTYKTKKGTELQLMQLKGKDYMMVAYRVAWLVDECDSYSIDTEILSHDAEHATVKTTLKIFDKDGKLVKSTQATKTEHKKDFNDFLEKAETGSLGRALSYAGFGTQFAVADMDEGARIVDTPLEATSGQSKESSPTVRRSSFRKPAKDAAPAESQSTPTQAVETSNGNGATSFNKW